MRSRFVCVWCIASHSAVYTRFLYTSLFRSRSHDRACGSASHGARESRRLRVFGDAALGSRFAFGGVIPVIGLSSAAESLAEDRKSTRLNSSHLGMSYADFFLEK